jgi:hypothetical protein
VWWIHIDPAENSWEITPARQVAFHANIRGLLEDGPLCTDCLKILNITPGPSGTKNVEIRIRHPWPGNDTFTGFDVRGIAMWNGSEVWPSSGLITQDPDSTDGYVANADGYTTIFNPIDFPPGSNVPLLTYTKGKFASATFPNTTLNPYRDYWTIAHRHMFGAGASVSRTWQMRFPEGGPFALGYAVDACWDFPDPNPPIHVPDDFPLEANRPEPYGIVPFQVNNLPPEEGETATLRIEAWDWQMDPADAWVECPELFSGKKFATSQETGPDSVTFTIPIENQTGAVIGYYRALAAVKDSAASSPPWDLTTYTIFAIRVAEVDCCLQDPIAVIQDPPTDIITGQEITLTGASYDPDGTSCTVSQAWDLNGDAVFDDGQGSHVQISWDEPGTYEVSLRAMDSCWLIDTETIEISVHVGITQPEDAAYRTIGTRYDCVTVQMPASEAEPAVDPMDKDGPWDFTALSLADIGNYRAILSPDHPEVAGFKNDFTGPYESFYKNHGSYTLQDHTVLDSSVYFAQGYLTSPDRIFSIGMHEIGSLGSAGFDPPIEMEFPAWIFTDVYYSLGIPAFEFILTVKGWGEGTVTVPYNGGTSGWSLVLKYELSVDAPDASGSLLFYEWILDDGTAVGFVGAINTQGETNYDPETGEITGSGTFNALSEIGPYD